MNTTPLLIIAVAFAIVLFGVLMLMSSYASNRSRRLAAAGVKLGFTVVDALDPEVKGRLPLFMPRGRQDDLVVLAGRSPAGREAFIVEVCYRLERRTTWQQTLPTGEEYTQTVAIVRVERELPICQVQMPDIVHGRMANEGECKRFKAPALPRPFMLRGQQRGPAKSILTEPVLALLSTRGPNFDCGGNYLAVYRIDKRQWLGQLTKLLDEADQLAAAVEVGIADEPNP